MLRLLFLSAVMLLAASSTFAADEKKAGKIDKTKLFATMDADGDGSVNKEEFTKGMEKVFDKLKEKAEDKGGKGANLLNKLGGQAGGRLFDKLDADGDGKLTKEEFEKSEFDPAKLKEALGKLKDKGK